MPHPSAPVHELEARIRALEAEVEALRTSAVRPRDTLGVLEQIIDAAPLAIYFKDPAFTYVFVNREYERLAARPRAQILGATDFDVFPEAVARLFREQDEAVVARSAPSEFRETIPRADGTHAFLTAKFPVRSHAGMLHGVAGVCTEITELERTRVQVEKMQGRLVQQERLAAVGELSAAIAHEVRNPLGVIFNALATLKRTLPAAEDSQLMLAIMAEEADRLNRLVSDVLALVRPSAAQLEPTAIAELVEEAISAARAQVDPAALVRLDVPLPLPPALVDRRLVRQALVNLIANAIAAPSRKSAVGVRLELEHAALDMLRVEVVDDGADVPAEFVGRVFTPFQTTRSATTGLGLAVVQRVAEAHRGTVSVSQTPGGGATFVLRVPLRGHEASEA